MLNSMAGFPVICHYVHGSSALGQFVVFDPLVLGLPLQERLKAKKEAEKAKKEAEEAERKRLEEIRRQEQERKAKEAAAAAEKKRWVGS